MKRQCSISCWVTNIKRDHIDKSQDVVSLVPTWCPRSLQWCARGIAGSPLPHLVGRSACGHWRWCHMTPCDRVHVSGGVFFFFREVNDHHRQVGTWTRAPKHSHAPRKVCKHTRRNSIFYNIIIINIFFQAFNIVIYKFFVCFKLIFYTYFSSF